jgi:hypothetical protein
MEQTIGPISCTREQFCTNQDEPSSKLNPLPLPLMQGPKARHAEIFAEIEHRLENITAQHSHHVFDREHRQRGFVFREWVR